MGGVFDNGVYETGAYFVGNSDYLDEYGHKPDQLFFSFESAKKEGYTYLDVFDSDGHYEVTLKLVAGQYVEEW